MDQNFAEQQYAAQHPELLKEYKNARANNFKSNNIPMPVSMLQQEAVNPQIASKFGHILSGARREEMSTLATSSGGFQPLPEPKFNNNGRHGPKVSNEQFKVDVKPVGPKPSDSHQWKSLEDMWSAPTTSSSSYGGTPSMPRLQQRPMNGQIDVSSVLNKYENKMNMAPEFSSAQYRSIMEKKAQKQQGGSLDYRNFEEPKMPLLHQQQPMDDHQKYMMPEQTYDNNYLANSTVIAEIAGSMAQDMFKAYIQEHVKMEKGKNYFTRVNVAGSNRKDVVKMKNKDGEYKYYSMQLKEVAIKK